MKTFARLKTSGRSLTLLAAAALLSAGPAFAASDAQAQARALLSGPSGTRTDTTYRSLPPAGPDASIAEPQEQARRLLAGRPIFRSEGRESASEVTATASTQDEARAYAGAQEAARKMILGRGA